MTHSILPPSSAGIWGAKDGCSGWVTMALATPEESESEASRLGTAAHEVAARYIYSYARAASFNPCVGEITSNNAVIDDEMLDAAELYADDVRSVMISTGVFGGPYLLLEQKLEISRIHEQCFGTPDCVIYDCKNHRVYIWDFKYGMDPVNVRENLQLVSYAAGVIDHIKRHTPFIEDVSGPKIEFIFRIAQPRAFHPDGQIREWRVMLPKLYPIFAQLSLAAEEALSERATNRSGAHCKYCQARHVCPAAIQAGFKLFEAATVPLPATISDDALSTLLALTQRASKQLEALKTGLEQQVETRIRRGASVRGYRVEPKQGRLTWSKPVEEVAMLGDLLGVELRKPTLITPKQAEKLGVDISVINEYTHKPNNGVHIVADDGNKAKLIFGAKN